MVSLASAINAKLSALSYEQRELAKSTPSVQNSNNIFTFTALQLVNMSVNQALTDVSLILSSKPTRFNN